MKEVLKEAWKFHRKSMIASALIIMLVVGLTLFSSIQGKFIWITQPSISGYEVATSEFSVWALLLSFILLISFLFAVRWKSKG